MNKTAFKSGIMAILAMLLTFTFSACGPKSLAEMVEKLNAECPMESDGFSVVRRYIGHGVGRELHEDPEVPNYGTPGRGVRLQVGMTLAIEPMINMGRPEVYELDDGWTVKTADGLLSAHYENSVALTEDGPVILTALDV